MCETNSNAAGVIGGPKKQTRLQQLKEERDYLITQLGRRQAQIILIESDSALAEKLEQFDALMY